MSQQSFYAVIFLVLFLLLVLVSHLLYRYLKWSPEDSRKFLHVSGGILALCSPLFFKSHWWVLILCGLAFFLLLFTYIKHLLPSVHQTKRKSVGSVIFPIPIYICFLIAESKNNFLLFYLPVSFMTISDTAAEWAGKKWGSHSIQILKGQKTLIGTLAFAICSIFISVALGIIYEFPAKQIILASIAISLTASLAELVSTKGIDNLTVPLITLALLILLKMA